MHFSSNCSSVHFHQWLGCTLQLHLWDLETPQKPRTLITAVRQSKRSREGDEGGGEQIEYWKMFKMMPWDKLDTIKLSRCTKRNWSWVGGGQGEGVEKRHKLESGMDSHLQSWQAPHSPPQLLPWQPDRRLGGGRSNEFLLSHRCRHLPFIHQLKGTMCHQRSFFMHF